MEKNKPTPQLPKINQDLMRIATSYAMPYYEVAGVFSQIKEYVDKEHPDFDEKMRNSYIMRLTEINIKKISISKGKPKPPENRSVLDKE